MAAAKKAQKEKLAKSKETNGMKDRFLRRSPSGRAQLKAAGKLD